MAGKQKIKDSPTFGEDVVASLNEFVARIDHHQPITIRTVRLDLEPAKYSADDVRQLRSELGVSQAVFAKLLAVSSKLVQHWEHGNRFPAPIARRLLDEIRSDPERWRSKLELASQVAHA